MRFYCCVHLLFLPLFVLVSAEVLRDTLRKKIHPSSNTARRALLEGGERRCSKKCDVFDVPRVRLYDENSKICNVPPPGHPPFFFSLHLPNLACRRKSGSSVLHDKGVRRERKRETLGLRGRERFFILLGECPKMGSKEGGEGWAVRGAQKLF